MITIKKDIDLMDEIKDYDTIFIGTNVYCCLSQGIQRDVTLYYPYCREANLTQRYGDVARLGTLLETSAEGEPTIVLLYIYRGFPYRKSMDEDYLDYDALEKCLIKANEAYKGKTVATTLLGCSRFDGNGNRDRVLEIMERTMTDVNLIVYDYYQKSKDEKHMEMMIKEWEVKKVDRKKYYEMKKMRKRAGKELRKKNGFAMY